MDRSPSLPPCWADHPIDWQCCINSERLESRVETSMLHPCGANPTGPRLSDGLAGEDDERQMDLSVTQCELRLRIYILTIVGITHQICV